MDTPRVHGLPTPNLGTPATKQSVNFTGMCIVKASGHQFVEGWNSFDFLTCYQEIGLLPKTAA